MNKAVAALALLALLFAVSLLNIRHVDALTDEMVRQVELSRSRCEAGDVAGAKEELKRAAGRWSEAETYTHLFLRHDEVDDVTDALCDVLIELDSGAPDAAQGAYDRLIAHIRCLGQMERISLGAVL